MVRLGHTESIRTIDDTPLGLIRRNFGPIFSLSLAKLESKGIVLAAMELGNEINWSNHHLGLSGTGRVLRINDLLSDCKGNKLPKGRYLQYMQLVAVLKAIRDHSQLNQHTPIISAGSGELDASPEGQRRSLVSKPCFKFCATTAWDQFVDAYGIHFYPQGNASSAAGLSSLQRDFAGCGSGVWRRKTMLAHGMGIARPQRQILPCQCTPPKR